MRHKRSQWNSSRVNERLERSQLGGNVTSDYEMERLTDSCDNSIYDPNNSWSPDYFSDSTSPENQYCTLSSDLHAHVPYHGNSSTSDAKPHVYCSSYGENPIHDTYYRNLYNYNNAGFIPKRDASTQPRQSYTHGQLHRGENVDENFIQYPSQYLQKTPSTIPHQCPALAVNVTSHDPPLSSSGHIGSVKLYSNRMENIPTQCEVTCSFDHQKQPLYHKSSLSQTPCNQEIKSIIATTADFGIAINTTVNTQSAICDERLHMPAHLGMHSNNYGYSPHFTSSQCSASDHDYNSFRTSSDKVEMNMQDINITAVPQKNTKEIANDDLANNAGKNPDVNANIRRYRKRKSTRGSRYDAFIMKNSCFNESNLNRFSSESYINKLKFQKKRGSRYDFRRGKSQRHQYCPMIHSSRDGYMVPRLQVKRELFRPWDQVKRMTINKGFMDCVNFKREMGIAEMVEWKYNMNRYNICNEQMQMKGNERKESRIPEKISVRNLSSGKKIKAGCDGRDEIIFEEKNLSSYDNVHDVKGNPTCNVSCSSDCLKTKTKELYMVHHKNLNMKELTNSLNINGKSKKIDINSSSSVLSTTAMPSVDVSMKDLSSNAKQDVRTLSVLKEDERAVGNKFQGQSNVQDHKENESLSYKSDNSKQCSKKFKKQKALLNLVRRKTESAKRKTSVSQTKMDELDKHIDLEITENISQDSDEKSGTVILHPKLRHKSLQLPISDSDHKNTENSVTSTTNVNSECKTGIEIVGCKHKKEKSKKIVNVKSNSVVREVNKYCGKRDEKKASKFKPCSNENKSKCVQEVQVLKSRDIVHQPGIGSFSKGKAISATPSTIKINPLQKHQSYTYNIPPKFIIEKPCKIAKSQLCVEPDKTEKVLDLIEESHPLSKIISEAHRVLETQSMDGHSMEYYYDEHNVTSLNYAEHLEKPMTEYCYSVQSFNAPLVSSSYFKPIGESNVKLIGHDIEELPEYLNEFDGSSIIETSKAVSEWSSTDETFENMGKAVDTDSMDVDNIRKSQTDKVDRVSEIITYTDYEKNQGKMINANKTEDVTVSANDSMSSTSHDLITSSSMKSCKHDDSKTAIELDFNQPSYLETLLEKDIYLPSIDTAVSKNSMPQQSCSAKNLSYEMHLKYMRAKKELDSIDSNMSYFPSLPMFAPDPSVYIVPSATVMDWSKYEEKVIEKNGTHCPNRFSLSKEDFEHYQELQMERIKHIGSVRLCDSKGKDNSMNGGENPRTGTVLNGHHGNNLSLTSCHPHGFDAVHLLCSSDSTTQTCDEMIDHVTSTNMFDTNDKEEIEKVIEEVVKEEYLCSTNSPDVENDFSWLSDEQFNEGAIDNMYDKCKTFGRKSKSYSAMDTKAQFGYRRYNSIMSKRSAISVSSRGRYNKKFPVSLPRLKYQPEKALYEAAVDFLGNFDKKNKRACRQPKEIGEGRVEITAIGVKRKKNPDVKHVRKQNEENCDECHKKFELLEENIRAKIHKDRMKKEVNGIQKAEINSTQEQNDDSDTSKQQKENINTKNEKDEDNNTKNDQNDIDTRQDKQKTELNDDQGTKVVTKQKMQHLIPKSNTAISWSGKGLGSHGKLVSMREHFDKSSRNNLLKTGSLSNICNKTPVIKMENLNFKRKLQVKTKTDLSPKEKTVNEKLVKSYVRCQVCKEMLDAKQHKVRFHYRRFHKSWCEQCQKDLKELDYSKHVKRNHDTPIFCGVCGVTFIYKTSFVNHCGLASHKERLRISSCSKPVMVPDNTACKAREVVYISSERSSDESSVNYISSSACEDVFSSPEKKVKVSKSSKCDTPRMEKSSSYVFENALTSSEWKSSPKKSKSFNPGSSGIGKLSKSATKSIISNSEKSILSSSKGIKSLKQSLPKTKKTDDKLNSCQVCKKTYIKISPHLATRKHLDNVKLSEQKIKMKKKKAEAKLQKKYWMPMGNTNDQKQAKIKLKRGRPRLSKETVKARKTSN